MDKEPENKFSIHKCVVCNGYGTLKYGEKTCQGCNGRGYVTINNKTGEPVEDVKKDGKSELD